MNITFNAAYLDDQQSVMEVNSEVLNEICSEKNQYKLNFETYNQHDDFMFHYKNYKNKLDFIFLDLDLNQSEYSGLTVYEEIRELNKEIIIVFISAHLTDTVWGSKVEELQNKDDSLFVLQLPFPVKRQVQEFYKEVELPVNEIIEHLQRQIKNFVKLDSNRKNEIIQKGLIHGSSVFDEFMKDNKDIKWAITESNSKRIIESGNDYNQLTVTKLLTQAISLRKLVYGVFFSEELTNYVNSQIFPALQSVEIINAKILAINEDIVALKCLLSEEPRRFQEREYSIKFFENAVSLKVNSIVEIAMLMFTGEIRFLVQPGNDDILSKFERVPKTSTGKFNLLFKDLPNTDEDNF